ncbi:MAG: ABC transporter ATP-binding protein [Desulfobulbaceae bacterium]|jgi:ABC-type polysaccharide/polyol phosphate transport system ATPase subunit
MKYHLYKHPKDRLKEALSPIRKKYHKDFYALKNVSFTVNRGEVVGILGKNGAGKSTLLKCISGILTPSSGKVSVNGKVFPLLELGSGFNPEFTGRENIYFYGMIHEINKERMADLVTEIIEFAGIGEFIDQPLKTYSTGMKARLAFAAATAVVPEVLIIDEVLSVGDIQFQRKSFARMQQLIENGTTVLFVSHSHQSIIQVCTRVLMMREGRVVLDGEPRNVVKVYLNSLHSSREFSDDELRKQFHELEAHASAKIEVQAELREEEASAKRLCNGKMVGAVGAASSLLELSNAKVDLVNFYIEKDGQKKTVLTHGDCYTLHVTYFFDEDIDDVVFPFWITTTKGLEVSGIRHPDDNSCIKKICKGSHVTISWDFIVHLLQGDYFVTFGITSLLGGEKYAVYRANDALMFKVINYEKKIQWGLVSLSQQLKEFYIDLE